MLEPSDLVVVETDGTYEQADSLKTAFDGALVTGFNVARHDLDLVAGHPGIATAGWRPDQLPKTDLVNRASTLYEFIERCAAASWPPYCGGFGPGPA